MRSTKTIMVVVSFLSVLVFFGCAANDSLFKAPTLQQKPEAVAKAGVAEGTSVTEVAETPDMVYVKDILLEAVKGKERLSIMLSEVPEFAVSRQPDNALLIKLQNTFLPDDFRGRHSEAELQNLKYVALSQVSEGGTKEVHLSVNLNNMVPYRVSRDESRIDVNFDVSALAAPLPKPAPAGAVVVAPPIRPPEKVEDIVGEKERAGAGEIVKYTGDEISLDFQDANIRTVFRLISEVSGYNIVVSPEVKKTITVRMANVPWDQALDTILEVNGLGKKESGMVITILPLEKLKLAEKEEIEKDMAEGNLQQISIEARIVEVTTTFARNMGVRWGYGYQDEWRSRDYGVMFSNSASAQGATEIASLPGGIGLTSSNVAVNFPSSTSTVGPGLGVVMGSSKFILDAKLSALEDTGEGRIISSPRVTTIDNVKATIKQGEEIPYVVKDEDGSNSVEFKDAALLLEVTPRITPDGKISMEVVANNDYADYSRTNTSGENPPIVTSSVESTIIVNDGDTIVVGGIHKTDKIERVDGIPWLRDIPYLGWLFKYTTRSENKREILIFVTPRIIKEG
ncbi:MAG: secretin and TonB N-terminal domain-containing protein [Deltaproteobacteria bacterium]|nr:secretin and TonB N-terminal domain-containing protein [Deltaproteobacteria bacterium]